MRRWFVLAMAMGVAVGGAQELPMPQEVVEKACAAAGGLDAFRKLGVLKVEVSYEEVTQDGKVSKAQKLLYFTPRSIVPVRLETPAAGVVAGDDGSGGWALVNGRPDPRPLTTIMVKRLVTTDAFPLTLPFSLSWPGVTVTEVAPAVVGDRPVWRLSVSLARNFFFSPQISTQWTVDVDQKSFALVRAESPYTDLGKGVVADGMRFTWPEYAQVGGVKLPARQLVVGLDPAGREKAHTRADVLRWHTVAADAVAQLFVNPIPPEQRPRIPQGQPVNLPRPR